MFCRPTTLMSVSKGRFQRFSHLTHKKRENKKPQLFNVYAKTEILSLFTDRNVITSCFGILICAAIVYIELNKRARRARGEITSSFSTIY